MTVGVGEGQVGMRVVAVVVVAVEVAVVCGGVEVVVVVVPSAGIVVLAHGPVVVVLNGGNLHLGNPFVVEAEKGEKADVEGGHVDL